MPLNLTVLMLLFCKNDNRIPGVFKVFLFHAGPLGRLRNSCYMQDPGGV